MPRVPFSTAFNVNTDNSIEPTQSIRVGGILLTPGITIKPGQIIAGIDFTQYKDSDLEIDVDGEFLVIKGIYGKE